MPIIKNENQTIQVEFGEGDTIPLVLGLPMQDGTVIPAMVILPMHEAMEISKPENQRKFTDFDVRMIFTNTNQVDFMMGQLEEARRMLSVFSQEEVENQSEEITEETGDEE